MERNLQQEVHNYFRNKKRPTAEESELLRKLEEENPLFQVTAMSRDDFATAGFNITGQTDKTMEEYAGRAEKAIMETYWNGVYEIGEEELEKVCCNSCGNTDSIGYFNGGYYCNSCELPIPVKTPAIPQTDNK